MTTKKTFFRRPDVLLLGLLILILLTPLIFGLMAKHKLNQLIAETALPNGLNIRLQDYDMGYLRSHAVLEVTLFDPESLNAPAELPKQTITFYTQADIHHGPLAYTDDGLHFGMGYVHAYITPGDIGVNSIRQAFENKEIFGSDKVVDIHALLGMTGAFSIEVESSPISFKTDASFVKWDGMKAVWYLSGNGKAMSFHFDISPMVLQGENESALEYSRIVITSDATRKDDTPWVGEQSINLPMFYFKDEHGNLIRFNNMMATAISEIKQQLAHVNVSARADTIQIMNQAIDSTELNVDLSNVDAASLVRFSQLSQGNSKSLTPEQRKALTYTLIDMLSPGAQFNLSHDVKMPEGEAVTNIHIDFPNLSDIKNNEPPETIAQMLIMQLQAGLELSLPSEWLENTLYNIALAKLPANAPSQVDAATGQTITPQQALRKDIKNQLATLSSNGILVSDNKDVAFNLQYNQGNIVLNGQTLTQEDLNKLMSIFRQQPTEPAPAAE